MSPRSAVAQAGTDSVPLSAATPSSAGGNGSEAAGAPSHHRVAHPPLPICLRDDAASARGHRFTLPPCPRGLRCRSAGLVNDSQRAKVTRTLVGRSGSRSRKSVGRRRGSWQEAIEEGAHVGRYAALISEAVEPRLEVEPRLVRRHEVRRPVRISRLVEEVMGPNSPSLCTSIVGSITLARDGREEVIGVDQAERGPRLLEGREVAGQGGGCGEVHQALEGGRGRDEAITTTAAEARWIVCHRAAVIRGPTIRTRATNR